MVRVSGFLDQGVDVERTTNNRQGRGNNYDGRQSNNFQRPIPTNRSPEKISSGRIQHSNLSRGVQNPIEDARGRGRGAPVNNDLQPSLQVRNQERLRPKLLSMIPTLIKQESIEMEPLLSSDSASQPSILTLNSRRKDDNRLEANTIRTNRTTGTLLINHRNLHYSNPTTLIPPRQYTNVHIDDEEGDIVCCDDCFRHEGTKNLCTIVIWAALVFFIMNRLLHHMSIYLHYGEETKVVVWGGNFTSPG